MLVDVEIFPRLGRIHVLFLLHNKLTLDMAVYFSPSSGCDTSTVAVCVLVFGIITYDSITSLTK